MSRELVTGASGFIGRALIQALSLEGRQLAAVARRQPAEAAGSWHLQDLAETQNLPADLLHGTKTLYHLAALAHRGPPSDSAGQARLQRINVALPESLARQAAAAGVARFVFLSSIGAMARASSVPLSEEDPCRPADPYGASKLAAEEALRRVAAETGLEVVILRPPLVVGPHAPGNLARLAAWAKRGRPLPAACLKNRRSVVGLRNLVSAILLAGDHPAAAGQSFIVSEPEPLSTGALFRLLTEAVGRPARFLPVPPAPLDWLLRHGGRQGLAEGLFADLVLDARKIGERLGWTPRIDLAEEASAVMAAQRDAMP